MIHVNVLALTFLLLFSLDAGALSKVNALASPRIGVCGRIGASSSSTTRSCCMIHRAPVSHRSVVPIHRAAATLCHRKTQLVMQKMASSSKSETDGPTSNRIVRILALHGSEGNAERFLSVLEPWKEMAMQQQNLELQISALTAPVAKGRGYAWWSMPPGVRSSNAETYESFSDSCKLVQEQLGQAEQPYDLIVGFSQGAILATALLALDKIPHPSMGYVLVGGAWPNPFTREMESLSFSSTVPRVLIVTGNGDEINPPQQSLRVQDALQKGGCRVTTIQFDGGHVVPTKQDDTMVQILDWIAKGI